MSTFKFNFIGWHHAKSALLVTKDPTCSIVIIWERIEPDSANPKENFHYLINLSQSRIEKVNKSIGNINLTKYLSVTAWKTAWNPKEIENWINDNKDYRIKFQLANFEIPHFKEYLPALYPRSVRKSRRTTKENDRETNKIVDTVTNINKIQARYNPHEYYNIVKDMFNDISGDEILFPSGYVSLLTYLYFICDPELIHIISTRWQNYLLKIAPNIPHLPILPN